MEGSVYFRYEKLPSAEQIENRLSSTTGLSISIQEHQPPEYTDEALVQFGLTNEYLNKHKKDNVSYYVKSHDPNLVCFISFQMNKKIVEVTGVSFYKKYYFEGALLLVLKDLGGIPSENLDSLVADYSNDEYRMGKEKPNFLF